MDPRETLIQWMDRAATSDMARMVAIARLNWRLIDQQVLAFTQGRVAQTRWAAQAARDNAEINRRVDVQMSILTGSSSSSSSGGAYVDPRAAVYEGVHNILVLVATHRGEPVPETPPALAARALDVLEQRLSIRDVVKAMAAEAPPGQRQQLQMMAMTAAIPLVGERMIAPMVRSAAAGAVSSADLHRLYPDALIAGQPAPAPPAPRYPPPPREPDAHVFYASLVDTLLYQAASADPAEAEDLLRQALKAASNTVQIDDDIAVLRTLVTSTGRLEIGPDTVRMATLVIEGLARRTEHRDDVALLTGWLAITVVPRGLLDELGPRVIDAARAVLGADLAPGPRTQLSTAIADVMVRSGRIDDAVATLDAAEARISEPAQLVDIELVRADLRFVSDDREGAATGLETFLTAHRSLPPADRRRVVDKLIVVWPTGRDGIARWVDEHLVTTGGTQEPERTGRMILCVSALARSGTPADRARAVALADQVDLGAVRASLPPGMREMFDASTKDFVLLVDQLRAPA